MYTFVYQLQAQSNVKFEFTKSLVDTIHYGFDYYKHFLFGLIVGIGIAWIYHRFLGLNSLKKSHETVVKSKDETIEALKYLVYERLKDVKADEKDKNWFKKLRDYFKSKAK